MTEDGRRLPGVKVKTAKGRKLSSTRWLQRQLNDPYVQQAKSRGFRSRAAFKLEEMNCRFRLFSRGQRLVDLGAAPGGWCQVAAKALGTGEAGGGKVVGLDLLPIEPLANITFLQGDVGDPELIGKLREELSGPVDWVLSDMAAPSTGHRSTDHLRVIALVEEAYNLAQELLCSGGGFLAKVLQGGTQNDLLVQVKRQFEEVRHVKPPASRKESRELYLLARGFRRA